MNHIRMCVTYDHLMHFSYYHQFNDHALIFRNIYGKSTEKEIKEFGLSKSITKLYVSSKNYCNIIVIIY